MWSFGANDGWQVEITRRNMTDRGILNVNNHAENPATIRLNYGKKQLNPLAPDLFFNFSTLCI
jgi:hypothetical protein